ncbi:toll/interleukin-1 receptor domain-containing protein [Sandaracinobacter neustonicus]|uniref:Toll/interleukin-1 receptor domain-containing protein n=1 Tax=Sandaracinobacter neustonicus TaxID=1715348 RepID=A0A501XE00_9SPHN|nr:toll/interleukin-1 receptor domain-containing protein [Sandaracinobacter neustonicus]TPE58716.1 toll/interleukin-1 receptor domain-containing protein [Sandaracinobacter neustonicus]
MLDPGQQQATQYSAFISYSRRDSRQARWLQTALESYRMPQRLVGTPTPLGPVPGRFQPVFLDLSELTAAPDLLNELAQALAASRYLIVLCTPNAAHSEWVNREITLMQETGRGDHILTALFEGDEHSAFPPALLNIAGNHQPLAADFRKEGDGRRLALLKLVAAMSGVGLGELVHREENRRTRRLMVVATACLAGMAAFGGISLYAMNARAQAEAERRKSEAMVNRLVTDLRGAVKPAGNLAMLEQVNEAAVSYFRGQSLQNMPDAALATRARLLIAMGDDAAARGDFVTARGHFEEAARTTAARLAAAPNDIQRVFDHSQSEYWLGHSAWSAGNPVAARKAWNEYARLANQLVEAQPASAAWHLEAGYAQSNLGVLDLRQNLDVATAEMRIKTALRHYHAALDRDPTNPTILTDIADGLAWLADSQRAAGKLAEARQTRKQQEHVLTAALRAYPDDIELKRILAVNAMATGRIEDAAGHQPEALARFQFARQAAARMVRDDPRNVVLATTERMAMLWEARSRLKLLPASGRPRAGGYTDEIGRCAQPKDNYPLAETEDWCRLVHARLALMNGDRAAARALLDTVAESRLKPGAPRLSARFGLDYAGEINELKHMEANRP